MKKTLITTFFWGAIVLLFSETTFAQQAAPKHSFTRTDYLTKSKKQKKVANKLLIGGAALLAISFIMPKGELVHAGIYCGTGAGILCNEEYKNDAIKGVSGLTGVASMLGSIPFSLAARKNKKRAMSVSIFIDIKRSLRLQQTEISNLSYPAVAIRINL
jgi:hypothetical protein